MNNETDADALLRRTLGRFPIPVPTASLADDIVRRTANYESAQRQRSRTTRLALLMVYWIAVVIGSAWVVRSLPLPAWTPGSLSPAAAWLVPCAGALLIWRRPILQWLTAAGRRLLSAPSTIDAHIH